MDEWYGMPEREVLRELNTSRNGLAQETARRRLEDFGENSLKEAARKQWWQVFLEQFQDLLVIILIIAALISMLSDNMESTLVIFAVLLLNAVLGTVQHQKAEKSLDSLRALSSPKSKVIREGKQTMIQSSLIVPGDILVLEAGDMIAADGRILESHGLQVNESSLTGESYHVDKAARILEAGKVALADQVNMVFAGSLVTGGRATAAVVGTGMDTQIGKIASLMNETGEHKTPLQVSLDRFSGRLAAVIMVICFVVFALALYRKVPVLDALMFAVAMAVAAIPEALSSIVTIVQAMGTQKMAKEHAIIKDLKAVESLGCVSVICSDKTGTLTQNRMDVQKIYVNRREWTPGELKEAVEHLGIRYLLYGAALNNDAVLDTDQSKNNWPGKRLWSKGLIPPETGVKEKIGDPMEIALLELVREAGLEEHSLRRIMPRMEEIPFDSSRKMMTTRHRVDGKDCIFVKGAVDVLMGRCRGMITFDGHVRPLTEVDRKDILRQNGRWSGQGLRVLAFAYRAMEDGEQLSAAGEDNLAYIGMVAMMDPPRAESLSAVTNARQAGIRPVMITGDHKVTAMAIAERIGIMEPGDLALTGGELDALSAEELDRQLSRVSVYARVSPEHKIRIVDAWQSRGHIVAMTGDGVNDAPALKKADIGVAMGITGTAVSKDAASMILADDNFATIIKAVSNGRNVYRNIKNAIQFLLSGNMAGILSVLYTSLASLPMPFAPVHLLFINLVTDSLPAIAIGMEPPEEGLLREPPRDPGEGILTGSFMGRILAQGSLIALCTMVAYHTGLATGGSAAASTMAFSTLTLARLFHGFNCRSRHSVLRLGLRSNLYSVMAFEAGIALLAAVLLVPGLQTLFAAADLGGRQLLTIVIFAFLPTIIIQVWKTIAEGLE